MSGPSAEGLPMTAPSGAGEAGPHRPGRPAEQVIADAISSVLVVPAETLAPLAERVADALGLPWPSSAGEAGPVLGKEAHAAVREALRHGDELDWLLTSEADMVIEALAPHVAALVAAAEERGAAAERERIADEIADRQHDELAGVIPAAGSTTQAYDYARRVARGQS